MGQDLFEKVDAAKRAGVTPTAVATPQDMGGDRVSELTLSDLITGRQPAKAEPSFWSRAVEAVRAIPDVARLMIEEPAATAGGFIEGGVQGAKAIAPTAVRVGAPMIGGALGTAVLPGVGTAAGAGTFGMAGEAAAEWLEGRDLNPKQIAVQGALSAVPVPGGSKIAQIGKSAVLGGAGEVGTELAEGRMPTLGGVARGAALGGAFGALGTLFDRVDAAKAAGVIDDVTPPPAPVSSKAAVIDAPPASKHDLNDEMNRVLAGGDVKGVSVANDGPTTVNASGGGMVGSAEENARNASMKAGGQKFVVVDRGGNVRPSTVDGGLSIKQGENFGVLNADGSFQVLDNKGGAMVAKPAVDPDTRPVNTPTARDEAGLAPRQSATSIERLAKAVDPNNPIPTQKPLDKARRDGEDIFIEKLPEHLRKGMKDVFDANEGFESQRRGVQSNERTTRLAEYIRLQSGPSRLNPRGTALNAAETVAAAQHAATLGDRVEELVKKIEADKAKGLVDNWTLAALAKARYDHTLLSANYLGARAETGRALQIQKQLVELFKTQDTVALEQAMKNPAIRANMDEFVKTWSTLKTDVERLDFLRRSQEHGAWDKVSSYFMANILSGPKTHLRNMIGNTMVNAFENVSRYGAIGYDMVKNSGNRTIFAGEFKPRAVGAALGLRQGLADAAFTMKHGYTPKALATFDVPRPEFTGKRFGAAGRAFNYPGRLLEAEDAIFHSIAYNQELYARLYAKARGEAGKQNLSGQKLSDYIEDRISKWSLDTPPDVADAAQKAASRMVLKEEPGKLVQSLLNMKENGGRAGKALNFILPFIKTPANILRQGYEATPAGAIPALRTSQQRQAFAAGGREEAEAAGRMIAGTAGLGMLAYLAANGYISGAGPKDPEQRAALQAEGWKPQSVKIGNAWVDYTNFQPLAQPLMAMANAFEKYRESGDKPLDSGDVAQVLAATGSSILDQSFLSGLSDLNAAVSDPARHGAQWISRLAQGFVPFSGLQRNIAQTVDPVVREQGNVVDSVKSIIPGASTSVPAKIDRFGAEVKRPALSGINPLGVSVESKDPLVTELKRLKVDSIGAPATKLEETRNMPGRDLTVDERKRMGFAVREALEKLIESPRFKALDDDVARDRIGQVVKDARHRVIVSLRAADQKAGIRK